MYDLIKERTPRIFSLVSFERGMEPWIHLFQRQRYFCPWRGSYYSFVRRYLKLTTDFVFQCEIGYLAMISTKHFIVYCGIYLSILLFCMGFGWSIQCESTTQKILDGLAVMIVGLVIVCMMLVAIVDYIWTHR